ncbi:protein MpBromo5 [Marchantia polymorpha subsp. ruderalis]|nr:hypothetical protein MARPO_0042s0064 [Marchantia polymorpha]BBN02326.1 hypothetical protein Mp_2g14370 [Marchantia polymorpha subsp. ruderalis]|eukprot:PTQ40025.1 hypothetical protein MARPO_0042s0064 [Marchantia polymorpha]
MDGPWVQSATSVGLKRKSMSLNADGVKETSGALGPDGFRWEPVVAKSREEKKELRKRLKMQLEQVEGLSIKIAARQEQLMKGLDRGVRATHSDAHLSRTDNGGSAGKEVTSEPPAPVETPRAMSQREARLARQPSVIVSGDRLQGTPGVAGKEKRTPKANQLYLNSEFVSGKDKMPPAEKLKSKSGVGAKRGAQGKASDARDAKRAKVESARSKRMSDIMKLCGTLLKKLISHKHAWVFNEPVDAVKLGLHDYHKVIKKPMDLGTIKSKLDGGQYHVPGEFAEDVRLTFRNAMTYNPIGHDVYVMAEVLRDLFEDRWKNIEDKVDEDKLKVKAEEEALAAEGHGQSEQYNDLKQHLRNIEDKIQSLSKTTRPSSGRPPAQPKPRPDDLEKRPMTFEEKRKLSIALENLPPDKLERIVQIIKKRNPNVSQNEDEIEVDIDSFDNDTLWELDRFVTNCAKSRGKVKKKVTPKEPPPRPEQDGSQAQDNGTGETPKKPRKGADAEEEDVDIDDDLAPTQCAPVVIEKDAGGASSSSSSSSSDSGSSSSDSDSGSSSGSDSDADEPQNVEVNSKASPAAEAEVSKKDAVDDVAEPNEEPLAGKMSTSGRQDEPREEGLPERQVSPEKLLRAALLRGRFADTILKAQEKTLPLNKNEKVDPEKLKRDREVLEKRQKEEKARLYAEAKAAEVTRRKAEAEAAAEARRKREAEREAARIELQQMEKTVEIDENSEILKDLEMLRSQARESSGDDGSPNSESPDGMPIFALQGGNPLHQLGLFIKQDDDDEDEDYEKHSEGDRQEDDEKKETENGVDVEEGEID